MATSNPAIGDLVFVISAPGKVAFLSPKAKEKFSPTKPKQVRWNNYYQELFASHHDIEVVNPADLLKQNSASKPVSVAKPVTA